MEEQKLEGVNEIVYFEVNWKKVWDLTNRFEHKETFMRGHDSHNTTVLSIIHNMSTTCFGEYYFWPLSGWILSSLMMAKNSIVNYMLCIIDNIVVL